MKKGARTIGRLVGDTYKQIKRYPRHYLWKSGGFGISLGLLNRLSEMSIEKFRIEVVVGPKDSLRTVATSVRRVRELLDSQKIQYAGYDEQRLFSWKPQQERDRYEKE